MPQRNKQKKWDTRKLWEVLDMSITLIVVKVSQVFVYVQILQIVHVEYVQLFVYKL